MECLACSANCYEDHDSFCDCNIPLVNHHTDIDNINEDLRSRYNWTVKQDEVIRIFFIGHNHCQDYVNFHDVWKMGESGRAYYGAGVITITTRHDFDYDDQGKLQYNNVTPEIERFTLIHEFGHMFALNNDHYGINCKNTAEMNNTHNSTSFSTDCMYGENKDKDSIEDNFIICEGCRALISSNAGRFD